MAEKRTCPNCGTDNYSADTFHDWDCCHCGAFIPKPEKAEED